MSTSFLKPVAVALMLALVPLSISTAQAAVKVGSYIGIWSAKNSYAAGDLITLNNKTFLSLVARNLNKNPDTNPTSWQLLGGIGATGLQGPIGLTGAAGSIGPKGDTGLQGLIGLTGPLGAKGDTGLTGSVGASGINGTNGVDGAIGPKGDTGLQGLIGLTGAAGTNGVDGAVGPKGDAGLQGLIGLTGSVGASGINGVDGAIGAKGDTGAAGTNGLDGAIGPKGDTGLQGLIGLTGPLGAKGDIGLTGSVGASGINGTNGVDGTIGPKGDIGLTGLTGTIGPKGDIGLTGLTGTIGPKGDTGLTGPQGLKGDDGLQGIAGAVGAKGDTGVAGSNGIDGAVGPKGDTGLQGPIGLTGADSIVAGPTGPRGTAGIPTSGTDVGDMQYWDGTTWVMIPAPNPLPVAPNKALLSFCKGVPTWSENCIPVNTTVYHIGDKGQAGGRVFYITDGGLHGLEAAPVDLGTNSGVPWGAQWGCVGTDIAGAYGTAVGTGAANTMAIVNGCSEFSISAKLAYDYSYNGYTDWYLPSKDELHLLFLQWISASGLEGIGIVVDYYWSSSEIDNSNAWIQCFCNVAPGGLYENIKSSNIKVHAIRSF